MDFINSIIQGGIRIAILIIDFFILIGEITEKLFLFFFISPLVFIFLLFKKIIISLSNFFKWLLINFLNLLLKVKLKSSVFFLKKKFFLKTPRIFFPKFFLKIKIPKFLFLKVRFFLLGVLTTGVIVLFYQGYLFIKNLPSPNNIGKINYSLSTHLYDRNGQLLYEIYRDQNRTPIKINELPKYVINATIAAEDKDFYRHQGISLIGGILRAIKETISTKNLQGGSTITQQLVKTALLTPERTIDRKIKEIILALWTEKVYDKNKILEMYLNQVPYGGAAYGIEEASKTYFGKSAKNLTLEEAAMLAGLPQAPSIYSPFNNPKAAINRRNNVLRLMFEEKMIDHETYKKAIATKLKINKPVVTIKAPHFVFFVKSQLEEIFGIKQVEEGGLRVITTLDINIQREAEKILKEELEKIKNLNVTNGAILITKPKTGEILAMVGSVDYFANTIGAFNVTTALRQPGSSIKPIMYSLALQKQFTAATIIDDSPIVFNIPGSVPYKPVNYDGKYHGRVPLRYALANSYNIPAVKVLSQIGVEDFIEYAKKLGITTWNDFDRFGLSLALGGGEVKMIDMAVAFGVLANGGNRVNLNSYLKIENSVGDTLKEINLKEEKVLDEGIAFIISDILSDNFARRWAFGVNSALEIPGYQVAVKTGTTDDKKDNWTIGYTPDFLVAVWVGNNDNTPMNPFLTSGITGAAPIWNRVMSYLLKSYSYNSKFNKPDNIVEKNCYFGRKEYFIKGTENLVNCQTVIGITPTPTP